MVLLSGLVLDLLLDLLLGLMLVLLCLLLLLLEDLVRMNLVHHLFVCRLGHVLHRRTRLRRGRRMDDGRDDSSIRGTVRYSIQANGVKGAAHFSWPVTLQSPKLVW